MTSYFLKLATLSAVLGVAACTTPPKVVDTGAVKDECKCSCKFTTVDGSQATGTLTFPSTGASCPYAAVDNYVPCTDDQGQVHPGTSYSGCQFTGVSPPLP